MLWAGKIRRCFRDGGAANPKKFNIFFAVAQMNSAQGASVEKESQPESAGLRLAQDGVKAFSIRTPGPCVDSPAFWLAQFGK